MSSMTPTLVIKDGRAVLGVGGSGGMTISTNVAQTVIAWLLRGTPGAQLVRTPRFAIPLKGGTIALEPDAPSGLVRELEARGETVVTQETLSTAVQVVVDSGRGKQAAGDPRKFGSGLVGTVDTGVEP